MDDNGWLEAAKKLPVGGRGRYAHPCGSGEAMIISHDRRGYSGYCNRCHAKEWQPHGQMSFAELMGLRRREKELAKELEASVRLPRDFTLDIPLEGRLWLFKASITPHRARQMGIGYSAYFRRVIIPIYKEDKLIYFQARALYKDQDIKYINPKVDRSAIGYWVIPEGGDHEALIITEDILSAIRVGAFVPTLSALGTRLSIPLANKAAEYRKVATWLDPDEAGIKGAAEMRRMLSLTTKTVDIRSTVDPKNMTDEEIQCHLRESGIAVPNNGN